MADTFGDHTPALDSPALNHFAITPHDSTDFANVTRYIYVGGSAAGDITIVTPNGDAVLYDTVPIGTILPIRAKRVNATGTATGTLVLTGMY